MGSGSDPLTVGTWFATELVGGALLAGADDPGWFPLGDLPPLAFPTDAALLEGLCANDPTTPAVRE